jgi:myosin-7
MEAERLRQEEEEKLRRQMNAKKAKQEAERKHKERIAVIEKDQREIEAKQRHEAEIKKTQIEIAEKKKNDPIDDSKMVEEMFGFIDEQTGEGASEDVSVDNLSCSLPSFFLVGVFEHS